MLIILLRICYKVNLWHLLLVLCEGLARHEDLVGHAGSVLLWNDVLAWVEHNDLLILVLIELERLLLMLLLMLILAMCVHFVHFTGGLHLRNGDDLVPWDVVALVDGVHWVRVSVSVLRRLLGWNLDGLLLLVLVLRWAILPLLNLNILRFEILTDFLLVLQKLSWWEILSQNEASV